MTHGLLKVHTLINNGTPREEPRRRPREKRTTTEKERRKKKKFEKCGVHSDLCMYIVTGPLYFPEFSRQKIELVPRPTLRARHHYFMSKETHTSHHNSRSKHIKDTTAVLLARSGLVTCEVRTEIELHSPQLQLRRTKGRHVALRQTSS